MSVSDGAGGYKCVAVKNPNGRPIKGNLSTHLISQKDNTGCSGLACDILIHRVTWAST
jgi:hypothetical protein